MFLCKCVRSNKKHDRELELLDSDNDEERVPLEQQDFHIDESIKFVYFACNTPNEDIIRCLNSLVSSTIKTFTSETECIEYINSITTKVFLIIDGTPSSTLLELIEPLKQIDSVFIYSSSPDSITNITQNQHSYLINWCNNEATLVNRIRITCDGIDKQTAAFSIYNQEEKVINDLSKGTGSFLFFNLFKNVLKNMPKTGEAKKTMVTACRNYYRGDIHELANIAEFDMTYRSADAIPWFLKETFINKLINKSLRLEDVDPLYQFRFYIMDLSEQLELKSLELRETQKENLKLYSAIELNFNDIENLQKNIGNLIVPNGYLLTSGKRSIAYDNAMKFTKRDGIKRVLFEYNIDLNIVKHIVVADVHQYSPFPEKEEFLIDLGASFQIDHCEFNSEEDLWYIQVHATDQGAEICSEYIEYRKNKMAESNIVLMFGNLLLEMGEYTKAERYFDTILSSSNPNNEEIACIFFNFGRTHRLKGDFNRAINCYNRAYDLHMNARPKRLASAGKTLNGLGVVYSELGKQVKAEECFQQAMKLYKKSIPKKHVDVAGTLINLGTIDCDRGNYEQATLKYLKAKKIYDRSLPSGHPNRALPRINLANVHLLTKNYESAFNEFENGLKIQQLTLPNDHPDLARTLHNLAIVKMEQGDKQQAKEYLERAEVIAVKTLSPTHPVMRSLNETKNLLSEQI